MESEKVKEIKEKLQEEIFIANSFGDKLRKVPTKELENLLTLINELESENELLRNAKVVYENVDYCYEDLKKAEKRITELESENKRLLEQRNKTYNIWVKDTEELKDRIAELEKENDKEYKSIMELEQDLVQAEADGNAFYRELTLLLLKRKLKPKH